MNTQGGRGGGIAIINADEDERLIMPGGGNSPDKREQKPQNHNTNW